MCLNILSLQYINKYSQICCFFISSNRQMRCAALFMCKTYARNLAIYPTAKEKCYGLGTCMQKISISVSGHLQLLTQ